MLFNHYWPFLIYLSTYPICFVCYPLLVCILSEAMLHSIKVLTYVCRNCHPFLIVPLTLPCPTHLPILP